MGGKDENPERGNWSGRADFFLSAIGYCVGLGNIWRFPYRAYEAGGAVFLIPYAFFLLTAGLPVYFLEMAFGQFGSSGPISIWKAVPALKGIGYAMAAISFLTCIYYNLIIAYALYYLFASFTSELPWQHCRSKWANEFHCVEWTENFQQEINATDTYCKEMAGMNLTEDPGYISNCTLPVRTPAAIYWQREVLDISGGIDEGSGDFKWDLTLCLLLAWIIVFVCLIKGIKSSGKVVYVTAIFPFVILTILLIRGATLPGASTGVEYYIKPESTAVLKQKLSNINVWYSAAIQIFYSMGIAFGGLMTMSSYNKFKNNIYRDAVFVGVLNCCTSVYAGLVIFSTLGYMAERTGLDMSKVANYGPGLVFVAYPEGIAAMPIAPLWSILFFFMVCMVGLDTQFAMEETLITAIVDEFRLNRWRFGKVTVTAICCTLSFLLGLPQCTRAGIYVMNLFDWYAAGFSLFVVSIFETIGIAWIYGFKRFSKDIELMIGNPCCGFFKVWLYVYWWPCWTLITPGLLIALVIYAGVAHTPVSYAGKPYPAWADGLGWLMVAVALVFIPLMALVEYCKAHDFYATMKKIFRPQPDWGPVVEKYRVGTRYAGNDLPVKELVFTTTTSATTPVTIPSSPYAREGLPAKGFDYHVPNGALEASDSAKRRHQQHMEQNQGYVEQNQGYREQNQGYKEQNQGYREQNQGYKEQNQGYMDLKQGYREQNQGYREQEII